MERRDWSVRLVEMRCDWNMCVSELKYLGCCLDESGTDETECGKKVVSGRRVVGTIRSLIN